MLDYLHGWAVATWRDSADHLLRTENGGQTWHDITPPEPDAGEPCRVKTVLAYFLDPATAWAVYSCGGISPDDYPVAVWSTRDGGSTWQPGWGIVAESSDGQFSPTFFDFVDPQNGWLLVTRGAGMNHVYSSLYRTGDGGLTWTAIITPDGEDGGIQACSKTGMDFISADAGWLAIDCHGIAPVPYFFQTSDAGRSWVRVDLPASPTRAGIFGNSYCGIFDPILVSSQAGLFVLACREYGDDRTSSGFLYRTTDGGGTWQVTPFPGGRLAMVGEQTLFAVSRTIYRSDDGGSTWVEVRTVFWDPQISFVDRDTAWAVASRNGEYALVRTADGCSTWKLVRTKIVPW